MRLQLKIVGVRRWPAPSLSPFASVTDWMLPSTPLKRCVFLKQNCTKTLQWVARLQPHWNDALFKLASVLDISMYHNNHWHMNCMDHCLCFGRMARTTGIFPGWTGYFQRKNPANLGGNPVCSPARGAMSTMTFRVTESCKWEGSAASPSSRLTATHSNYQLLPHPRDHLIWATQVSHSVQPVNQSRHEGP